MRSVAFHVKTWFQCQICHMDVTSRQGRTKGWASWLAARGANLQGALRRHWNNRKLVLVNSGFHARNNFSANDPQLRHARARENVRQPRPKPKRFKNTGFNGRLFVCPGRRIINLPGASTCLEPPYKEISQQHFIFVWERLRV